MNKDYMDKLFFDSSKTTFENAKALRKTSTDAEAILWECLRGRKVRGLKFRRQHPINHYIADFYCQEIKLVIEVDGGIHNTAGQKEYDEGRTFDLNEHGINVIRFTNEEISEDLTGVINRLSNFIEKMNSSPHPK